MRKIRAAAEVALCGLAALREIAMSESGARVRTLAPAGGCHRVVNESLSYMNSNSFPFKFILIGLV